MKWRRITWMVLAVTLFFATALAEKDAQNYLVDERQAIKQARKFLRQGEFLQSEEVLRGFLKSKPDSVKAKLALSYVLLKQRRFLESFNISLEIAKNDNKNARAYALVGSALLSEGNFSDVKPIFINAINLDRREALAWAGLGMLEFYENRVEEGVSKLREAVFLDGEEPDFQYAYAQVSARNERYKEAAQAYRDFLRVAPKKDKDRRDRILGLIDFLEFLGNRSGLYDLSGASENISSVELVRQRPVIKVKIGRDKREFRFVLDTGSGVTVLSDETAKEIGIEPVAKGGLARAIGGNGKFAIVYGFLKSISIGDVRVGNVPVYIRKFHDGGERVDGFIGLALISRFLTTLDYGKKTFTLIKRNEAEAQKLEQRGFLLPLRLTSSGFLSGEVKLKGIESPLNFIVDTGASISVISNELASSNEISPFKTDEKMRVIGAAGVIDDVSSFLLPKVTVGVHSQEHLSAIALSLDTINEASGFTQAGILGGNFLQHYSLTFDFKNSRISFVPINK